MICVQENVLKCKENRKMQVSNKVRKALIMLVLFPFSFTAGGREVRKEGRAAPQATRRPALPPPTPQEIHALGAQAAQGPGADLPGWTRGCLLEGVGST